MRRERLYIQGIWASLAFFAVQATYEAMFYIFGSTAEFDSLFRAKYVAYLPLIQTHGVSAATALCLGLLQFQKWTRRTRFHLHLGRIYLLSVAIAGLTALPMAAMAEGGFSSRASFMLMANLWLVTGWLALRTARSRDFAAHRRWMIRNYALTYSAVLSRLLLNGLQASGWDFLAVYPWVTWSWLFGLATGEWWIWYSKHRYGRGGR